MDQIDFSKIYSYSKLDLFKKCSQAYDFFYLDPVYSKMKAKLRREPENIWPFQTIGKAVHDAITLFFYLPEDKKTANNLKEQLKGDVGREEQLSLFAAQPDPTLEQIKAVIEEMDINKLTPIQALSELEKLKETLGGIGDV